MNPYEQQPNYTNPYDRPSSNPYENKHSHKMDTYESSFNMPQMSSLGGDTFNLSDINDILNECENENKNEE
jgi:hypothetical protein